MDFAATIENLEQKKLDIDQCIRTLRTLQGGDLIRVAAAVAPREGPAPLPGLRGGAAGAPAPSKPESPRPPQPPSAERGRSSPVRDACFVALRRSPLTSADVFDSVRKQGIATTSGSVYQCLRENAAKGLVELRNAEDDGLKKWHLTDAGKAFSK